MLKLSHGEEDREERWHGHRQGEGGREVQGTRRHDMTTMVVMSGMTSNMCAAQSKACLPEKLQNKVCLPVMLSTCVPAAAMQTKKGREETMSVPGEGTYRESHTGIQQSKCLPNWG